MTEHPAKAIARLAGNPLLDAHEAWLADADDTRRTAAIGRYAFAVPTDLALRAIAQHAPAGVVEVGAGTGYWARLLADRGVDVVAYDVSPPPSPDNHFFAGVEPWFQIAVGAERVVILHSDRLLLLVWPTKEAWAADALRTYAAAGGERVAYVGEPPGGRMGDDQMHALLGLGHGCLACEYSVTNAPCVCAVEQAWELVASVSLPHWGGYEDDLYLFERCQIR